jgi:hypothetical protein
MRNIGHQTMEIAASDMDERPMVPAFKVYVVGCFEAIVPKPP